jgi:hypothetical protein
MKNILIFIYGNEVFIGGRWLLIFAPIIGCLASATGSLAIAFPLCFTGFNNA